MPPDGTQGPACRCDRPPGAGLPGARRRPDSLSALLDDQSLLHGKVVAIVNSTLESLLK